MHLKSGGCRHSSREKDIVDEILFACSNDSRDCNTYFIDGPGNLNLKFVLTPY